MSPISLTGAAGDRTEGEQQVVFKPTLPLSCQVDERLRVSADGMYRRPVWLNESVTDELDKNTLL